MKTTVRLISASAGVMIALGLTFVPAVAQAAAPAEEIMSPAEDKHGAQRMFERALDEVELRPEQQKAVEELKAEAEERHKPVKEAKRELMNAAADQVEAGKIDRCALDPQIERVASAKAQAHPGDRAAFEKLHSILDKDQRAKFVDALQRRWEARRQAHDPTKLADKMARELGLTDEQKGKVQQILSGLQEISQALGVHEAHSERWTRILEAFKGDRFVLDEISPAEDVAAMVKRKMEGHLWAAEALLPVLTKDQRGRLAEKLRGKARGYTEAEED